MKFLSLALRICVAVILLQTLYFKFTAQPESVVLFTKLHAEPVGRIGTGIAELIASILILIPATLVFGALFSLALMTGAILSHLFVIGVESAGDGGQLFALAIVVWLASAILLAIHRKELVQRIRHLLNRSVA